MSTACVNSFYISIVGLNMCLSFTVDEILSVEYWRDLDIWVRGRSRSLKMAAFDRPHTTSVCRCNYSSVLYHFRDKARYYPKITIFSYPCIRYGGSRKGGGVPSEYCHTVWCGKTRMVWLPDGEKRLMIV